MKRNKNQISKSINLLIYGYLLELEKLKDVFRIHTMNHHLLREKVNYPHLKEGASSFNDAACPKTYLRVEAASPEA